MSALCPDIEAVLPPLCNERGLSLDQLAIEFLRHYEPPEGFWNCDSFGKDSGVCLDLLIRSGVAFESHHSLTTIDPPELVQFGKKHHPETVIDRPSKSFVQYIRDGKGLPLRTSRWCCEKLKHEGGNGRTLVVGLRREESAKRAKYGEVHHCNKDDKWYIKPIYHWSTEDVWEYTRRRMLPYCTLYAEGWKRLGCIMCPLSNNAAKEAERWPKMRDGILRAIRVAYPAQKGFQKFGSPEAVLDWWLHKPASIDRDDETQDCFAFDQFEEEPSCATS